MGHDMYIIHIETREYSDIWTWYIFIFIGELIYCFYSDGCIRREVLGEVSPFGKPGWAGTSQEVFSRIYYHYWCMYCWWLIWSTMCALVSLSRVPKAAGLWRIFRRILEVIIIIVVGFLGSYMWNLWGVTARLGISITSLYYGWLARWLNHQPHIFRC